MRELRCRAAAAPAPAPGRAQLQDGLCLLAGIYAVSATVTSDYFTILPTL